MVECFIIIGRINKKLILVLVGSLIELTYNIINFFLPFNLRDVNITMYNYLVISISQMLVRLYPLILKISNEKKSNIKISKKKIVLHYFFLCLIFASIITLEYFTNDLRMKFGESGDNLPNNNPITFSTEMIVLICISTFCLKYKYFKHHIISLIILILIGIPFLVFYKFNLESSIILTMRISHAILNAIYRCYQKYMMEKLYYTYWNIAFIPGVILFPFALVWCIIFTFPQLMSIRKFKKELSNKYVVTQLIFVKIVIPLIYNFIMSPLTIMIVYYFSPDYILIITLIASYFETLINNGISKYFIFLIIIQIFFIMIYLEIFELNFCGLNKNTRRNIHLRSENDLILEHKETIDEDDQTDINKNYFLDIEEENKDDIQKEEEQEEQEEQEEGEEGEEVINS